MSTVPLFNVISFEQLKRLNEDSNMKDYYEPTWDQTKGVIRMAIVWSERLGAERGDLVNVEVNGRSATYTLKMSSFLTADTIALDYDQQKQLGLLNLNAPVPLKLKKAGQFGTFSYLWKHVDPAIRLPFRISIWLAIIAVVAGSAVGFMIERTFR